jgi:uncharacterized protein (TIGR03437 family)
MRDIMTYILLKMQKVTRTVLLILAACWSVASQTTATIDVDISINTPVHPGFAGVSTHLGFPVEYGDYRFNAIAAAPIYYVSPNQASFLVPPSAAVGAATVKVTRAGSTVSTGSLTIAAVSPGLYTANGNGAGVAAAAYVRASTPNAAAVVFSCQAGVALSCLSTPISLDAAGGAVYLTLYASGVRGAKDVQVYVAGQSVPVPYAGAQGQYQGLDQINITLPATLTGTGEASVYVVADGKTSNMATLTL